MMKDTRSRNQYFSTDSLPQYFKEYSDAIASALNSVDTVELEKAKNILRLKPQRVFVGGNGGSAAISDHLNCDFTKGVRTEKYLGIAVHSLVGSQALFTAIGNDIGYEKTLSYQLDLANINSHDSLILISSSGNSPNIIEAARLAKNKGVSVIGMTGFTGGALITLADARLHVPVHNYGVIEDCHQIMMHVLAQFHYLSLK